MWTQWRRWNWGLQHQIKALPEPLTTTHGLHLTPLADAHQLTAGQPCCRVSDNNNTACKKRRLCRPLYSFPFFFFFFFNSLSCCNKRHPSRQGSKRQNKWGRRAVVRQQRARVILGVLSDAVVSESSVFALWSQCGQSIWLPSEQRPAALDLQIPVDSVIVSVCVCVHVFFILSFSNGFASPRLELLHNIDPQYDDIAPCKSSLHLPSLTSPSPGPKAFSPHMLCVCAL